MSKLSNKVALVTGSSRGIGAAIAKRFAQEGAKVVVHGRDVAAMTAVQTEIERSGGQAIHVSADITSFAEIEAVRQQVEQQFGPIDILVANAGAVLPCLVQLSRSARKGGMPRSTAISLLHFSRSKAFCQV